MERLVPVKNLLYGPNCRTRCAFVKLTFLKNILTEIRACRACEEHLPLGPRPIVQGGAQARLLIVGQAPGLRVHQTGIPWNDKSGDRLREWLGLEREIFYDPDFVALLPMGFCYPGRGKSGDAPPRKECYDLWHEKFRSQLKSLRLTLLVGNHAQTKYLKTGDDSTTMIREWRKYLPNYLPLPHPSPRNNIWLHKNPWFQEEVIPEIRTFVAGLGLGTSL